MTSNKPRIVVSQHGTLVSDLYFWLYVHDEDELEDMFAKTKVGTSVLATRQPPENCEIGVMPIYMKAHLAEVKLSSPERSPYLCSQGPEHAAGIWGCGGTRFDEVYCEVTSAKRLSKSFISTDCSFIVNAKFGHQLRTSGLRGFEILPLPVIINQSGFRGTPPLEYLQVLGKNCLRRWRVEMDENLCPLCRQAPIYCPECGWIPVLCTKCFQPAFKEFEYVYEGPDLPGEVKHTQSIVEVKDSNGADFFRWRMSETMISRRALIFLMNSGAAPFIAMSHWACIDGLTPEQQSEVEEQLATPFPHDLCRIRHPQLSG